MHFDLYRLVYMHKESKKLSVIPGEIYFPIRHTKYVRDRNSKGMQRVCVVSNLVAIARAINARNSNEYSQKTKDHQLLIRYALGFLSPPGYDTVPHAWLVCTKDNKVIACSNNGGIVDLKKIDDDFHSKLSHDFIKSFDFNLKEIMPLMIVGTKIEQENICFIDTPGYNPPNSDETYTQEDVYTAKEFLSNASSFIWLIGADANGTISSSDIDFLNELDLENKNVYVVYNKADLRSQDDIEAVLGEIEESLDDYGIECIGISAFSSLAKQEYAYKKQSLFEFIKECDYESQVHADMIKKLYEVYAMYKRAILTNIKE